MGLPSARTNGVARWRCTRHSQHLVGFALTVLTAPPPSACGVLTGVSMAKITAPLADAELEPEPEPEPEEPEPEP